MEYTALYRKFRPTTFSEIVGQEHITKTIRNQIVAGRVGHAYLFNGGRGTGKTSAAKILARAINCLNPKDGEPCNECEICKGILSGSLTDVVEMDAASNNSVEDIRSIREEVNFLPTLAKYRVYIIDEVHMLSTGAFNALLKTLEEPPAHVKFILATTEPQKIPATILSRCQRFDFKKISTENIIKRLRIVCKESNIEITEEALTTIAVLAEGAMRDALSILERCLQDGETNIDENKIKELVGIPKLTYVSKMTKAIIEYNVEEALNVIDEILAQGKDINNLLWELIKYAKDILVYKTSKNLQIYSKDELAEIEALGENVSKDRLLNIIYELSELENTIKWSTQKTIMFQTGIIKLCMEASSNSIDDLNNRILKIEQAIRNGIVANNVPRQNGNIAQSNLQAGNATETRKTENIITRKMPEKTSIASQAGGALNWPAIVNEFKANGKIMLYTNLLNTNAKEINDMTVGIEFPNGLTSFGKTVLEKPENMQELVKAVSLAAGKEMRVKLIDLKNGNHNKSVGNSNGLENLDIPINFID